MVSSDGLDFLSAAASVGLGRVGVRGCATA
jgi:hypothetical protein